MSTSSHVPAPDNWIYYAETGNGVWSGNFTFTVTNWRLFWADKRLGVWDRFFCIANYFNNQLFGKSKIDSVLCVHPEMGPGGIVTNVVYIKRFGITLYKLEERYVLDPRGTDVYVHSRERYGPFPALFIKTKKHPARILAGGKRAIYTDMPILGTIWSGEYQVNAEQNKIDAVLHCHWAKSHETIHKQKNGPTVIPKFFQIRPISPEFLQFLGVTETGLNPGRTRGLPLRMLTSR